MALPLSCFGKLPFHREYLRIGLDGEAGRWLVRWVEGAHREIAGGRAVAASAGIRFAVAGEGGGWLLGIVRDSTDGLRRHPIALTASVPGTLPAAEWPLAAEPIWIGCEDLLARSCGSVDEFTALVRDGMPAPRALARATLDDGLAATGPGDPWCRLTGLAGEAVRHVALNLVAVGRAQREARSAEEGIAVMVPLRPDGSRCDEGVWIAALIAATGNPRPTGVLLGSDRLFVFFRPLDGVDLASALATDSPATIDDLSEAWQGMPPQDPALAAAIAMVGTASEGRFTDILAWIRSSSNP